MRIAFRPLLHLQATAGSPVRGVAFLEERGFQLPEALVYLRLWRVVDAARRNELLFIYCEDIRKAGGTLADLRGRSMHWAWNMETEGLRERALSSLHVVER
jgi:hypothetical protein